jgi:hypothetical protein
MTASPSVGFANAVSLTVKKGASTASVTFKRYGDGTFEFVNANGLTKRYPGANIGLKELFNAISALV